MISKTNCELYKIVGLMIFFGLLKVGIISIQ